jgi:phage regulator Rha-like protein
LFSLDSFRQVQTGLKLLEFSINHTVKLFKSVVFGNHPKIKQLFLALITCFKILKSILNHDFSQAEIHWQKLNKQHPELYQDEFQYKGGNDLFCQCLRKMLLRSKKQQNQPINSDTHLLFFT